MTNLRGKITKGSAFKSNEMCTLQVDFFFFLGSNLDVDLPELNELKVKAKQHEWLDKAKDILEDPMADSFDHIKEVIEEGMELPPSPKVEKILGELSGTEW